MPWFILITAIIAGIFISFVVVRKRLAKHSAMEGETEDKPIEARLQQDADEVAAIPQLLEPKSLPQEPIPHGIYAYEPSVLPETTLSPQENTQVERVSAVDLLRKYPEDLQFPNEIRKPHPKKRQGIQTAHRCNARPFS